MSQAPRPSIAAPLTLACCLAGITLLVTSFSTGLPESGDGVAHYMIARYMTAHPALVLDSWGKPLFTLLAAPFTLLGMAGTTLFNALVALCTAYLLMRHIARIDAPWAWVVPLLLATAPFYAHTVMAGLTEPLFGALTVAAALLAIHGRWRPALIITSFLPFSRPEYVAFTPMMVLVAMVARRWKDLPWLFAGPVLMVIAGTLLTGVPMMAFRDPYMGVDTYGSGTAFHFIRQLDQVLGVPLLLLLLVAVVAWPVLWWRGSEQRQVLLRTALLTAVPAAGILLVHSYAWWKGGHGSLGLLRVLATMVPLLVLFCGDTLARALPLARRSYRVHAAALGLLVIGLSAGTYGVGATLRLPYEETAVDRTIRVVALRAMELHEPGQRLVYTSPSIGLHTGLDPMDTALVMQLFDPIMLESNKGTREGDLLIWDSHHMRMDGHLPFSVIRDHPRFRLLERIRPEGTPVDIAGIPFEMALFRCTSTRKFRSADTLFVSGGVPRDGLTMELFGKTSPEGWLICDTVEFPLTLTLQVDSSAQRVEEDLLLSAMLAPVQDTAALVMVVEEVSKGERLVYETAKSEADAFHLRQALLTRPGGSVLKIYLWNRAKEPLVVERLYLERRSTEQE